MNVTNPASPNNKDGTSACHHCHQDFNPDSDSYFRSFPVSYDCPCGETHTFNAKTIDRALGIMVANTRCNRVPWVRPDAWCPHCKQNLVQNWQSCLVFDNADEVATEFTTAKNRGEKYRPARHFAVPQSAQAVTIPLMNALCEKCGNTHWYSADGYDIRYCHLEEGTPLRCWDCGQWGVWTEKSVAR